MSNPLANYAEFAPYSEIQAKDILPALEEAVQESQKVLNNILASWRNGEVLSFDTTLAALMKMEDITSKVWTPVENLLSLSGTDEIREEAEKARPKLIEFYNEYSLNPDVYRMIKDYSLTEEASKLDGERKRHLENTLIEFKLSGAELQGEDKEEFKELNLKLADLTQKFSDNVTDSKFELIVTDQADLLGLPDDILKAAQQKALELRTLKPDLIPVDAYVFNLDYPSYIPFMKFSAKSDLKKKLYLKYLTKATERADAGICGKSKNLDNTDIMQEIFAAHLKQAQLLGYKNYAELSLETKMAGNPYKVKEFLERLAAKAKPLAEKEYQELLEFQQKINYINSENDFGTVYPWDKDYLQEQLRKSKYDFDSNILKPYFELEASLHGMFAIAKALYQVDFRQVLDIPVWHSDVRVYEAIDNGNRLGVIYVDLFPRDIKRQGAWVMPLVPAYTKADGSRNIPQCALVCNLTRPTMSQPSLLTQVEIVTLFHEFGHALHHIFSTVNLSSLSGTDVEWDFVELPSQLHENFVWEKDSLSLFAKHYQTQEPIPEPLLNKMLETRFFHEGLDCIRQLEFGLFDLTLYLQDSLESQSVLDLFRNIISKYGIFAVHPEARFPNSFSHIFAGGYSAGYYSYKWAEILEADAFGKFQEFGVLDSRIGLEFREKILSKGDTKPSRELFVDFMGREPDEAALLQRMGL